MARTAALKLPTEVPTKTSASSRTPELAGLIPLYSARITPTSYAPKAPPPESTRPDLFARSPLSIRYSFSKAIGEHGGHSRRIAHARGLHRRFRFVDERLPALAAFQFAQTALRRGRHHRHIGGIQIRERLFQQ